MNLSVSCMLQYVRWPNMPQSVALGGAQKRVSADPPCARAEAHVERKAARKNAGRPSAPPAEARRNPQKSTAHSMPGSILAPGTHSSSSSATSSLLKNSHCDCNASWFGFQGVGSCRPTSAFQSKLAK